jgi:alpha-L-fucosidase 2
MCCITAFASKAPADLLIWFDTPASAFTQSLPLGNGRLGAMVFGGVDQERIILNEGTLWSGSHQDADRPDAAEYLPEIRRLLLEGKNVEAEKLVYAHFTSRGPGSAQGSGKDAQYGSYQTLGSLKLAFPAGAPDAGTYRRELDLSTAVGSVSYHQGGVGYRREVFVSVPDQAIIVRLTADKPGLLTFDAKLDRPERFAVTLDGPNGLLMSGQLNNGSDGKGMKYAARLRIVNHGGQVSAAGDSVQVKGANEAILFITAATDYQGFAGRRTSDPIGASKKDLDAVTSKSYRTLIEAQIRDYQQYFNRVRLDLGPANSQTQSLTTPARLKAFSKSGADPGLEALYFQFGRYLLISSSRPGGLPANLQGIWAEGVQTPWNGDWHLNINIEMNYWPSEVTNLSELGQPLFAFIDSLREPGARTAKLYYGAGGWVAHVLANPWGFTAPGEGASWGATTTGSAWLCQHLWDHYLFTRDKEFLKWAYPIMKGSAQFYSDMLIEEPTHNWLVTAPSNSPENAFKTSDGKEAHIVMGPTVDMQILRYLFDSCVSASEILGVDSSFRKDLREKRTRLAPTRIGSDGRVMEWLEEYAEPEPHHRHVSHLWALYPGSEITLDGTPDLAAAARKTLEVRGDISTGWSLAHKINFWARLGDGNRARRLLALLLTPVGSQPGVEGVRFLGGSYDNLFDAHPPFQIDGNFGATGGIAEMLLQSQDGVIRLLPALPDAWPEGHVVGLRARGGFEVDLNWVSGKLVDARVMSTLGGVCKIRYKDKTVQLETRPGRTYKLVKQLGLANT